jgi:hypothetical protein
MSRINYVKVKFANNKLNYITSINSSATLQDVQNYYINQYFNVGSYPIENMQQCIDIEYFNCNDEQITK